jgi:hypothetical protein
MSSLMEVEAGFGMAEPTEWSDLEWEEIQATEITCPIKALFRVITESQPAGIQSSQEPCQVGSDRPREELRSRQER